MPHDISGSRRPGRSYCRGSVSSACIRASHGWSGRDDCRGTPRQAEACPASKGAAGTTEEEKGRVKKGRRGKSGLVERDNNSRRREREVNPAGSGEV